MHCTNHDCMLYLCCTDGEFVIYLVIVLFRIDPEDKIIVFTFLRFVAETYYKLQIKISRGSKKKKKKKKKTLTSTYQYQWYFLEKI